MAKFASNLEKKPHRKEAIHNGNKVRLFNWEFFRKIIFSGLSLSSTGALGTNMPSPSQPCSSQGFLN